MSSEGTKPTIRPGTCYDQIQVSSDWSHGGYQKDDSRNQTETRRSKQSKIFELTRRQMFIVCPGQHLGTRPRLFLSIVTVQKHVQEHEKDYPVAVKDVKENMYVDDILNGDPDDDCAVQLKDDLCNLLSKGAFPLTKWASNSQKVMEATLLEERAPTLILTADPEKMSDSLKHLVRH